MGDQPASDKNPGFRLPGGRIPVDGSRTLMKIQLPAAVIAALLISGPMARTETLSPDLREALLARLRKLQEMADARVDAQFRAALGAYRAAAGSNQSALDFYLKCVEKVNFEDQKKKASEYREWKRQEADKLSAAKVGPALRLQLRWLMLTLQAASERAEPSALAASAAEILNAVYDDAEQLSDQQHILNESVTSTVFARAYGVGNLRLDEKWPRSPAQIGAIYDEVLMPPLRKPSRAGELRAAWNKRIQQEITRQEFWGPKNPNPKKKIGTVESMRSPEYDRFMAETVPNLQWQMEKDLFSSGDENEAAKRMLAHIEKNLAHASARSWAEELADLLGPGPKSESAAPD